MLILDCTSSPLQSVLGQKSLHNKSNTDTALPHMYNRSMRAHKMLYEALARLQVEEFSQSLDERQTEFADEFIRQANLVEHGDDISERYFWSSWLLSMTTSRKCVKALPHMPSGIPVYGSTAANICQGYTGVELVTTPQHFTTGAFMVFRIRPGELCKACLH